MNSSDLRNILCAFVPKDYETGVYACDQLNVINSNRFAIICNNQISTQRGMHWIAFFKKNSTECTEMFDSFGMPVNFYLNHVSNFLKRKGNSVTRNDSQLQSSYSNYCGQFCVYFLAMRIKGVTFNEIIKSFSLNYTKNDFKVYWFVKHNFNPNKHSCDECICNHICSNVVQCSRKKKCIKE